MNKFLIRGKLFRDWKIFMVPVYGKEGAMQPMAVNTVYERNATGKGSKNVDHLYMDIVIFAEEAEKIVEVTKQGDQVEMKGYLRQRKYPDKTTGQNRYKFNLIVKVWKKLDESKQWDIEGKESRETVPWD